LYHGKLRAENPIKALYNRGKRGKRGKKNCNFATYSFN